VKRDIGLDERDHRRIRRQRQPRCQHPFRGLSRLRGAGPPRDVFGGEPRGQPVEGTADLVEITNSVWIDL